jgi:hypothetical protein
MVEHLFKKVTGRERVGMSEIKIRELIQQQELAVQDLLKHQLAVAQRLMAQNSEKLKEVVKTRIDVACELEAEVAELLVENDRLAAATQDAAHETGGTGAAESIRRRAAARPKLGGGSTNQRRHADNSPTATSPEASPRNSSQRSSPRDKGHTSPSLTIAIPTAKVKEPQTKTTSASSLKVPMGDAPTLSDSDDPFDLSQSPRSMSHREQMSVFRERVSLSSQAEKGERVFTPKNLVFADANTMKARLQEALCKPQYNVCDFYHDTGTAQKIARSQMFDNFTLLVIAINSVWIAYDTDFNDADVLKDADPIFQIVENLFCIFFTLELSIRFAAFVEKNNCMKDGWFCFDSMLVGLMIFETWVITAILVTFDVKLASMDAVRSLKLLKLARVGRLARLLRAAPELMIMIKAIFAALRSVTFAFGMLLALVYVFAILMTQLLKGSLAGEVYFSHIFQSFTTLLLEGAFPDNQDMIKVVGGDGDDNSSWVSYAYAMIVILYLVLSSLTVLNMLVGILCDVVSEVSKFEKEEMLLLFVREELVALFEQIGVDPACGAISRSSFEDLLSKPSAIKVLHQVGVDVVGLVDQTDFIFEGETELPFPEFFDLILKLRGTNTATVKDMVDLRKLIRTEMDSMDNKIAHMKRLSDW